MCLYSLILEWAVCSFAPHSHVYSQIPNTPCSAFWLPLPISELLTGDFLSLPALMSGLIFCTCLGFLLLLMTRFLDFSLAFVCFMALPDTSFDLQYNSLPLWWIWLIWGPWILFYLRLEANGNMLPVDGFVHERDFLNFFLGLKDIEVRHPWNIFQSY